MADQPENAPPQPAQPSPQSHSSAPAELVEPTATQANHHHGRATVSRFRRMLNWSWWVGLAFCILMVVEQRKAKNEYFDTTGGLQESFLQGDELATDKIAVISVNGVIMEGNGFVKRQIDRVREDDTVKAIVLRVNSPGGTVTGSDFIYHHLTKLREDKEVPIVVSMGDLAASGGYYVSMCVGDQEKSIYAEPTTTTGSIGVIIPHYNVSGLMARYDVVDDSIMSHPRKQMLSMTRELSDEHRAILQDHVNETFDRFKEIVHSGRPMFRDDENAILAPDTETDLATGEIFSARRAKACGLVDEIGFIEAAIERAAELASLKDKEYRVVRFERTASLMSLLGSAQASTSEADHLETLLDLGTPRAYYLMSSFPALVTTVKHLGTAH